MEDYYEYLDSNGVTTLYKLIKDDTVALIDSYSVTINGITTNLDNHVNNTDIHTPISDIEGMIDTKVSGLVNSAPETLDTLKELSDALGNDPNFATTVANQVGTKASKDDVYTKEETDTLLEGKANSVHSHVVSDITDFPTIPTKLSQLENDMGFGSGSGGVITSISWTNITDKPNFATVATSGSYNDLSNKPTIPKVYNKTLTIQNNGTNVATFTSNSNTDVTANITVPTKVSELSNDSGFITGISWDKITNKPTLAKVATSGSYTDLSNIPTIPTKVSQLENDTGFINALTDVVDIKSNQTINGVKTFTASPFVSNYAVTNGFFTKLNTIARNEIPSQIYHSAFRVFDKNSKTLGEYCVEKSTSGSSLLHMDVHTEDSEGNDIMESVYLNLSNDGSTVSFHPAKNNKTDLGMSHYKWAKIYSDDVVHTSGDETINGAKTFTQDIILKDNNIDLTVTPSSTLSSNFIFKDKNNQNVAFLQYAKRNTDPDILGLYINDKNKNLHGIQITSNNYLLPMGNNIWNLGSPNNKWANVYATTFNGNLKGNADTATKATSADSVAWENVTGKPSIPTTPNAYVTATWASGSNWYRKWSNGFIEQGGVATGLNLSSVGGSITLPIPFSNANYIAVLTPSNFTGGDLWSGNPPVRHNTSTTTTLKWGVYGGIGGEVCWYACGY